MNIGPTSPAFFEAKYRENTDPWDFASSRDELFRYERIISALDGHRFRSGFEPACSIGVLTARLALHCDRLLAFDLSQTAAARAAERCSGLPHVEVRCASLAGTVPDTDTDLLVLSEVGYYFSLIQWEQVLARLLRGRPGCTVVAAHWLGVSKDHCISGDEVHKVIRAHPRLILEHEERQKNFRLDRLVLR